MRDAIILSGWNWQSFNVPERLALALARSGSRVLYCENPVSLLRRSGRPLSEISPGVFALGLRFVGHRLNSFASLSWIQARLLVDQIIRNADKLGLKRPLFIYPHGDYCLLLCKQFKRMGFQLVHICMDYELSLQMEHVRQSDLTLAIPAAAFQELKQKFGQKIRFLPQFSSVGAVDFSTRPVEPAELSSIPRPRLGYLGNLTGRASVPLLREVLSKHPQWHFLSFETKKWLPLQNEHVLPWRAQGDLAAVLQAIDVGFMPYDCLDPKNFHCVPLKLFDYFSCGMPVVSTPIAYVSEYRDLVYTGGTGGEVAAAISAALAEPLDSPKRAKREALAAEHSLENQARTLAALLDI